MSNATISVKGLKKSFKDKEVLKGVDFEVRITKRRMSQPKRISSGFMGVF